MTPWLPSADPAWQLAGWTMLLFLGVGTAVAALGAAVRLACRRAAPNARYAISLATLLALATTPIAVAAYLGTNGIPTIDVAMTRKPPAPPVDSVSLPFLVGEEVIQKSPSAEPVASIAQSPALGTLPAALDLPPAPSIIAAPYAGATPGQSPGLNDAPALGATAGSPPSPLSALIAWLPVVWLAGAPLTFALLAAGLVGSRSLRRNGTPLVEGPVADACRRLQRALGVTRRVALAACDHVAQPVLIGILRPTILLPAAAIAGWSPADLEMILLHELAHVRRWDNLVNLIQRLIESLLFFHPCVWLASRQVRRDREDCCDELVVRHTNEPEAYATLLINVASSTRKSGRLHPRHTAALLAASTMAAHPLANRVRRILKIEDEPMRISRRMLVLILLLAASVSTLTYRAFAVPAPVKSDTQEKTDEPITVVYSADQIDRIPSRDWARLMSMPDAETTRIRWDFRQGESARITGPQGFHDKIESILAGRGDEWPHYTKFVTGNRALIDAVDRTVESLTADRDAGEERADDAPVEAHATDANAADDSDEHNEAIIRRVYEFADADQVNVADWMRLIANGRRGVEVRWFDDSSGLVISAPVSLHKQIADFLEASHRRVSADARNISALNAAIIKHKNQLDDVESELTEIEVLKKVALQAARSTTALEQAIEYELAKDPILKALQASVHEIKSKVQQLQAAIQDRVTPGQEEQLRMLQADQSSAEELLASYREKAEKEARERLKDAPNEALRAAIAEYNVRKEAANKKQASVEATIADLETNLRALTESSAGDQSAQPGPINADENDTTSRHDERAALREQLAQRKLELAEVANELEELKVQQEVALQGGPGSSNLDEAVADEIERDPQIRLYQEQLFALKMQIQQLASSTRDPENATLKRYQAKHQEIEQGLTAYRSQVEKEVRERLARMPHDTLREAEAAYEARREPLVKKQTVLEAEIVALEAKLKGLAESDAESQAPFAAAADPGHDEIPSDINVVLTTAYKIENADRDAVREWLRVVDAQPDVRSRWHADSSILVVSAPRRVQGKLTEFLNSRRLLRDPNAAPLEIPRPRAELDRLQQALAIVVEELRKAEDFEQAAREHVSTPESIQAAVDAALNRDPNLQSQADEVEEAEQQLAAMEASDASEPLRQAAIQKVAVLTARLQAARDEVEQATRARLNQVDYRHLSDDVTLHKSRLKERQADLERAIADAEAQLAALAEAESPASDPADAQFTVQAKVVHSPVTSDNRVTAHLEIVPAGALKDANVQRNIIALARSAQVLEPALEAMEGELGHANPFEFPDVPWLQSRLTASFANDSPILELGLACEQEAKEIDVALLRAVIAELKEQLASGFANSAADTQRATGQQEREYEHAAKLLADGKPLDALRILNKVLVGENASLDALIAKGDALKALKYFPEAAAVYSRVLESTANSSERTSKQALKLRAAAAAAYTGRGQCFMAMTPPQNDVALSDFANAIDIDRDNPVALAASGHIHVQSDPQRAIAFLSEALLLAPNSAAIYRDRALAHGNLGQFEQALDDAEKATELEPDNIQNEYTRKGIDVLRATRAIEDQSARDTERDASDARSDSLPTTSPPAPEFRYEGKTFDEWSDALRYELSVNRRLEAANAVAAFARAGRGRDAAEAILDVAVEYDFADLSEAAGPFKHRVVELFTRPWAGGIAEGDWLGLLAQRLAEDRDRWRFALELISNLRTDSEPALKALADLEAIDDAEIRSAVAKARDWGPRADEDFGAVDKNRDGSLTEDELEPTFWARFFAPEIDADSNDDGVLSPAEYKKGTARMSVAY